MRSRYTAYVLGRSDHLLATWHPEQRPPSLQLEPGLKWLGLEVREHRQPDASHAQVEFVARYRVAGRAVRLHERSRFVRGADGCWSYVDGDQLEPGRPGGGGSAAELRDDRAARPRR